jgi:hypothetical protein
METTRRRLHCGILFVIVAAVVLNLLNIVLVWSSATVFLVDVTRVDTTTSGRTLVAFSCLVVIVLYVHTLYAIVFGDLVGAKRHHRGALLVLVLALSVIGARAVGTELGLRARLSTVVATNTGYVYHGADGMSLLEWCRLSCAGASPDADPCRDIASDALAAAAARVLMGVQWSTSLEAELSRQCARRYDAVDDTGAPMVLQHRLELAVANAAWRTCGVMLLIVFDFLLLWGSPLTEIAVSPKDIECV